MFFLYGCHNKINTQVELTDNEIDFSRYKKFSWPDLEPMIELTTHIDSMISSQIKDSVLRALETKGYQFTLNSTSADIIVSYALSSSDIKMYMPTSKLEVESEKCFHPFSKPFSLTEFPDKKDLHSIMIISVFDVNRCIVVWQARVKALFDPNNTEVDQIKQIQTTVEKLLKDFPTQ